VTRSLPRRLTRSGQTSKIYSGYFPAGICRAQPVVFAYEYGLTKG